ncbi:hypothetical protein HC028_12295 [Planosporangium flavigriseum]|uniref:Activator of Hsp90 ATPase homologue 1/2-like C-terminal domain-containing protein n=1 Tax=Planosporangium flavigriseum TaxID=373681 RepID=A0A8J3PM00_9ACTN|nr:SRPBCC domain-containing protein [Planosporangium flavigriseum]NJC65278.1 hypothetical protein [Planosporangium flavigriseum]GIG73368.1 hypothetical protein Pfl04_17720 [Planosporangium flavigriseum]
MNTRTATAYLPAVPEDVWIALTDPGQTPEFLFGLAVESEWSTGSAIRYRSPCGRVVGGQIVHIEPGRLLVHSFTDCGTCAGDPTSWVTWELQQVGIAVCRVSVTIDEPDTRDEADPDGAWATALANLEAYVAGGGCRPAD